MANRRIIIGNDHGGFELKQHFVNHLKDKGYEIVNVGSDDGENIVRYPYYAAKVSEAVAKGEVPMGILICSTGIGMSILANRYAGVRASHVTTTYQARMTRAHNNSNVLCLGGKITGLFEALDILDTWLTTDYEGGRHDISLGLIEEAEKVLTSGKMWHPGDENR